MNDIRYLLDENIAHAVRDQLLRREPGIPVVCVGDPTVPPLGTPDPDILAWIEAHDYILVSRNRRTIPVHLEAHLQQNKHVPGVLLIRRKIAIRQVIEELLLIWQASETKEYRDQIKYLPL